MAYSCALRVLMQVCPLIRGFPIAEALSLGADVVVTGRCVDSALTLGPLIHKVRVETPLKLHVLLCLYDFGIYRVRFHSTQYYVLSCLFCTLHKLM